MLSNGRDVQWETVYKLLVVIGVNIYIWKRYFTMLNIAIKTINYVSWTSTHLLAFQVLSFPNVILTESGNGEQISLNGNTKMTAFDYVNVMVFYRDSAHCFS